MLVLLLPGLAAARRVAQFCDQTWPVRSRALRTGSSAPIPVTADRFYVGHCHRCRSCCLRESKSTGLLKNSAAPNSLARRRRSSSP